MEERCLPDIELDQFNFLPCRNEITRKEACLGEVRCNPATVEATYSCYKHCVVSDVSKQMMMSVFTG